MNFVFLLKAATVSSVEQHFTGSCNREFRSILLLFLLYKLFTTSMNCNYQITGGVNMVNSLEVLNLNKKGGKVLSYIFTVHVGIGYCVV